MANIVNNMDLDKINKTVADGKSNKDALKKPVKLHGEWILDESKGYQFKTELAFEKGKQVIEIDSPSFLGGSGNRLGPMAYCVAGITSCFIATFVSVATSQGIKLTQLNVNTECRINFAKTFDVSDEPITEGITFDIDAKAENADKDRLRELLKMAEERCPAMYSMSNVIKVDAQIKQLVNGKIAYRDSDEQMKIGIVIQQTDAETVWNALRFAKTAVLEGHRKIFLLGAGVEIEGIKSDRFNVKEQLDKLNQLGGEMLACDTCIKSRNMQFEACPIYNEGHAQAGRRV